MLSVPPMPRPAMFRSLSANTCARALGTCLLLLLPLSGCGDFPRPFMGNPGATAMRLAVPPPPRLAVPVPADALLGNRAATSYAGDVADALAAKEVPAIAEPARRGDWQLAIAAQLQGNTVIPRYTVRDPRGQTKGSIPGDPVPASAWADGTPSVLKAAAQSAAGPIAELLTGIDAALKQSNPNSLLNRPAQVYVPDVKGAPGDGDITLAKLLRQALPRNGEVVQTKPQGADFTVQGTVKMTPDSGNQQRVEVSWRVTDVYGKEVGKVTQLNDVPKGSLDQYWGDVALAVVQQAAGGIREVIANNIHPRPVKPATAAPPAAKPTPRATGK